tara:strand:- start:1982 stop:3049 length:1068 start_codon:yes stop_codon:yes gene_type:complete
MANNNLCLSIKSKKNIYTQCPNKKKCNSDFCGKHQINPIYFIKCTIVQENDNVLSVNELYNHILENKQLLVSDIRKSIKNSYLKNFIKTKLSKQNLICKIKKHIVRERYYINNEDKIIKIQSLFRMFSNYYRYNCVNEMDILTMNNKMEIPRPYFYRFKNEENNKFYAYDIRLLYSLINSNYPSCPYTFREFTDSEKDKIIKFIQEKLESNNISVIIKKELTEDEIMENKIKDLFYKINMLDNYTNHKWFLDLNVNKLIKLYISAEDIWNYRSLLTIQSKYNIIQNNHIFNIPVMLLRRCKCINKLRNILIDTFDIMVSNGIDINEKKLGAILVLSALVEVSPEAANALPHLIQI